MSRGKSRFFQGSCAATGKSACPRAEGAFVRNEHEVTGRKGRWPDCGAAFPPATSGAAELAGRDDPVSEGLDKAVAWLQGAPRSRFAGGGEAYALLCRWVGGPVFYALEVLRCFGSLRVLQQPACLFQQDVSDLGWGGEKELATLVDEVDPAVGEDLVQFVLQRDRIFREVDGVNVISKRH